MDDIKAKQQVVEKIKAAKSVLVTVSKNPSVDALSATIALALLVDKLDKHATAVFSGQTPPAITFLQPEKTFEATTDSLRDFVIALDKEKADHIQLKLEGDVAKIYITPYRTTISADDLSFSQGEFNVDLVVALGVDSQAHLDAALDAHGKVFHDAPTITITAGEQISTLGGIDWHDQRASSLSEMVAGLGEALKDKESLTDKQVATALLTGIVAATDRFSNPHTTSASMTVAAQLMADGADQQLIATELEKSQEAGEAKPAEPKATKSDDDQPDAMNIVHGETLTEMDARVKAEEAKVVADSEQFIPDEPEDKQLEGDEPSLGGTLNATTDEAAEENRRDQENDKNKVILSHAYVGTEPTAAPAMSGATVDEDKVSADPLANKVSSATPAPEPSIPAEPGPIEAAVASLAATAPNANVSSAYALDAPAPATPAELGLPMPPSTIPDFSAVNGPTTAPAANPFVASPPTAVPERLGDILAPEPTEPAAPAPSAVPPTAPGPVVPPLTPPTTPTPSANDPSQFKIPGQ